MVTISIATLGERRQWTIARSYPIAADPLVDHGEVVEFLGTSFGRRWFSL